MRLYKALLHLYPSSFRKEYEEELVRIFRERRTQIYNPLSIAYLWLSGFVDVVVNAACAHCEILCQDLRYTARTLRSAPVFALTAIVVTGLGIGANTAAFSITDRVLLRPLPFPNSDRLVQFWQRNPAYARFELSPPNFYDWRRLSTSFELMSAYATAAWNFVGEGDPQRIEGTVVTPAFFNTLDVQPLFGRTFTEQDGMDGAAGTVVLSYEMWQSVFGGRHDVLGNTIRLDNSSYTVIGVMPADFFFPARGGQLWKPLVLGDPPKEARDNSYLNGIGKLKGGVGIEKARAELTVIADRLAREYPKENEKVTARVDPLDARLPDQTRMLLWASLGASFCVLLIACTNLANLLLAKAMARRKELTVRSAIGAGRERLIRQLLTESMALAVAGGFTGILIAMAVLPVLSAIITTRLPLTDATVLDLRVLAFTGLVTLATGFVFGILPAWRACSGVNMEGLREGSRSGIGGRRERLRSLLVIAEISLSIVLLVTAGLLSRALWRVQSIDPGFRPDSVLTIQVSLPTYRYGLVSTRTAFYAEILSKVRALPGVANAALISSLPMTPGGGIWPVATGAQSNANDSTFDSKSVGMRVITPAYFGTMGIPIRAGRDISQSDTQDAPPVAVVSESFVQKYWPNQNALGRKFHFAFSNFPFAEQDRIVVGVVGDVRFRGLERQSEPQVYLADKQLPDRMMMFYAPRELVIRTAVDSAGLIAPIRRIIQGADPELPISAIRMMRDVVDVQTAPRSAQIALVTAFAVLSLLLGGIGVHGLLSFTVGQRLPEFGLRIALGAQSRQILSMILRESIVLASAGAFCGLLLSYYAGNAMRTLLAGVSPIDPATLGGSVIAVLGMSLSGSLLPAIRAIRTDPTKAMRVD
jgi:putative ABC transport system permease protein